MKDKAHLVNNHFFPTQTKEVDLNPNANTPAFIIPDFMRINPPTFHGTKVGEDPQSFIHDLFKVVDAMGVTPKDKAELAAYQLKDVAKVWFEKWRYAKPLIYGSVD